jgi:hypothetical protein
VIEPSEPADELLAAIAGALHVESVWMRPRRRVAVGEANVSRARAEEHREAVTAPAGGDEIEDAVVVHVGCGDRVRSRARRIRTARPEAAAAPVGEHPDGSRPVDARRDEV